MHLSLDNLNKGSSFLALTKEHMCLYAATGHKFEPGIAINGVCNSLSPNCIVLDHLIIIIKVFSKHSTFYDIRIFSLLNLFSLSEPN